MHGGGVRAPLKSGKFTAKDAKALLPFNNTLNLVVVTGANIRQAIEHGLKDYMSLDGNFLQISGGTYSYDDRLAPGHKLVSVTVGGKPLVDTKEYKVAIPSFLVSGGSGFNFHGSEAMSVNDQKPFDSEVLFQYVKSQKKVNLKNENRIVRVVPDK
jgi:5'-nucleotidase